MLAKWVFSLLESTGSRLGVQLLTRWRLLGRQQWRMAWRNFEVGILSQHCRCWKGIFCPALPSCWNLLVSRVCLLSLLCHFLPPSTHAVAAETSRTCRGWPPRTPASAEPASAAGASLYYATGVDEVLWYKVQASMQ